MSGTLLAFDFGTKSIGVAVGQRITGTARPLTALKANDGTPDWNLIERLLKEWQPDDVIVGLPLNMDGTEGSRANKSRRFAQRLANTAGVPVVLWDERRTTVSAAAILADNDTFGAKRKERLDSVSAAVILESFLNWRAHHPDEEPPELVRPEV